MSVRVGGADPVQQSGLVWPSLTRAIGSPSRSATRGRHLYCAVLEPAAPSSPPSTPTGARRVEALRPRTRRGSTSSSTLLEQFHQMVGVACVGRLADDPLVYNVARLQSAG